jgi:8-oxo-dGTP pyrophosphatase MutT (NUDIX family)
MHLEKSCGGVVFTRRDNEILYVIIRHRGGHCGFPKGHIEPGETEQETALREIYEEVGLQCRLLDGFRAEDHYALPGKHGTMKQVVYFLAEFADQSPTPQPEEIARVYLLPFEEALKMLPFPEARRILTQADQFVRR